MSVLPAAISEVRFVYEIRPKFDGRGEKAEKALLKFEWVRGAVYADQTPTMDVLTSFDGSDSSELQERDRQIRKVLKKYGIEIVWPLEGRRL